ncbi:MAG: hypothetical protein D6722_05385 [Bacteroidetes bacterium]|nr:MAG: hypothetical protein D6722_05385 [Bacteroidota bacterium]
MAGEALQLQAGRQDYFMTTTFSEDEEGVLVYTGRLEPVNGSGGSLEIAMRHYRLLSAGESPRMDSALAPGNYDFYTGEAPPGRMMYEVQFTNEGDVHPDNVYQWDFGDGTISQQANPVHIYTDSTLLNPEVCLETLDPSGCTTSICNPVNLADSSCQVDFRHELYPGLTFVTFFAEVQNGQPPYTYLWNFGDGYTATLGNPGYFFADPDHYEVCLTVTDATGCQATTCKTIAADPVLCEHNFSYEVLRTRQPDPYQFATVEVTWTDAEGRVYRSAAGEQPAESYFELLSAEPYEPNADGVATQRVRLRLQATLFGDTDDLIFSAAEGTFGLGHP